MTGVSVSPDAGPRRDAPEQAWQQFRPWTRRRWLVSAGWALAAVVLFFVYLRVSQTEPGDSYGAVFTLQAWDMLHGNFFLHGWWLSDVSFFSTELPEYMLVTAARGVNPDVVHIAGAITFTLLLLAVCLLAKGRATGNEAVLRVLLAAGIMCSPQLGNGIFLLVLAPDHLGSCLPVLLAWLILDRSPRRWYGPAAVGVLLAWALIADSVVLLTGTAPLVFVCAVRTYQRTVQQRQPLRAQWYEASLLAAGLAAAGVAHAVLALIRTAGGFRVNPVSPQLTGASLLPSHLSQALEGISLLYGGDFFGHRIGFGTALLMLHLAGLGLAAWASCLALRRFGQTDLVAQLLVTAIVINLTAFLLWTGISNITLTREIVAVLPFGAVLAARLLAGRLAAGRLLPALAVVLCGYLVSLGVVAAHPAAPPLGQRLTAWLAAHDFRYGIGASWMGSVVTVSSGEQVQLRPVRVSGRDVVPSQWESQRSWFDPWRHDANFFVLVGHPAHPSLPTVLATFGDPARAYHLGQYTVLAWQHENLLTRLR